MSIEVRHMQHGRWTVTLLPETPPDVIQPLTERNAGEGGFFGHVFITPIELEPILLTDAIMLADPPEEGLVRWCGLVRTIFSTENGPTELSGPGLLAWLGDEAGRGDLIETPLVVSPASFVNWVTAILAVGHLNLGTITEPALPPGGHLSSNDYIPLYVTPLEALKFVCAWYDCEFRVNPNGTLDAGPATTLFPKSANPTAIAVRKPSGHDPAIDAVETSALSVNADVEDYATRLLVLERQGDVTLAAGTADISPVTPYKDLFGNPVVVTKTVDQPDVIEGMAQGYADSLITHEGSIRRQIPITSLAYDVEEYAQVGDSIWVYDPIRGLVDTTNQVYFRGETVYPISQRVYALTWPIEKGMGVYYRDVDGAWMSLTHWMVWEGGEGAVDIERPLVPTDLEKRVTTFESFERNLF